MPIFKHGVVFFCHAWHGINVPGSEWNQFCEVTLPTRACACVHITSSRTCIYSIPRILETSMSVGVSDLLTDHSSLICRVDRRHLEQFAHRAAGARRLPFKTPAGIRGSDTTHLPLPPSPFLSSPAVPSRLSIPPPTPPPAFDSLAPSEGLCT